MHHSKTITACLLGAAVTVFLVPLGAGQLPEIKCLDGKINILAATKGWLECAADKLPKEDIEILKNMSVPLAKKAEIGKKAEGKLCIPVCQWKNHFKSLSVDGKTFDEAKENAVIDEMLPEAARAAVKKDVKKCFDDHAKTFDEKDNCVGYKPFFECYKKSVITHCKIDPKEIEKNGVSL